MFTQEWHKGSWHVMFGGDEKFIIASDRQRPTLEKRGWTVVSSHDEFEDAMLQAPEQDDLQVSTFENDFIPGEGTCLQCGKPAQWVEINFEARICSDLCMDSLNREYYACGGE